MIKDIQYLNARVKQEITAAYQRLSKVIGDTSSMTTVNEQLLNEAAAMIGEISVKAKLLDQAIELIKPDHNPVPEQRVLTVNFEQQKACVQPGDLIGIENFKQIQTTSDGISHRWTGERKAIDITLLLDRSSALKFELYLVALIKPRFSKQMKIYVDNKWLRHRFKQEGAEFVSSCIIPASKNTGLTKLTVDLPATFTPAELGVGTSTEKKGIAISRMCFEKQL